MTFMSSSSTSLAITVAHAVSYLISPLVGHFSATTITKLQTALEAGLASVYAATWVPGEPLRGSGRRCLSFSPKCLPPRPIYHACIAAGLEWGVWSKLLGGNEFDMFVDPGCVSIRPGSWMPGTVSKIYTVWSYELEVQAKAKSQFEGSASLHIISKAQMSSKTLSELLIEDDAADEEELFSMISNEVRAPAWMTPLLEQFPIVPGVASVSSRASSRNSLSSSEFSTSSEESFDSYRSFTSVSMSSTSTDHSGYTGSSTGHASSTGSSLLSQNPSRRERVRQARVFIDTTKVEVTPYDGGKTTVLTGGVMLGIPPAGKKGCSRKTTRHN